MSAEISESEEVELRKVLGTMPRMFKLMGVVFQVLGEALSARFPELDEAPAEPVVALMPPPLVDERQAAEIGIEEARRNLEAARR